MPSNRTTLIAGNWKMNNDREEAKALASALVEALPEVPAGVEVCGCPPTIDLCCVSHKLDGSAVKLGAQNVYFEAKGAYTGETSVAMLKSVPVQYCIIGHSERRDYFHETDEDQNKKAAALIAGGIVPIFCCGEPLEVREAGTYVEHVVAQVKAGLTGLEVTDPSQLVVAYEPIWAIGTGKTATADDAQEVCGAVREALAEILRRRARRRHPRSVRRLRQARQYRRARGQARCGRRPRGWRVPRGRGLCFDGREGRGVAPVRSRAVAQRAAAHSFERG